MIYERQQQQLNSPDPSTNSPYRLILHKLTGVPLQRSAVNTWRKTQHDSIELESLVDPTKQDPDDGAVADLPVKRRHTVNVFKVHPIADSLVADIPTIQLSWMSDQTFITYAGAAVPTDERFCGAVG
ncbi:hypothetical protein GALMADRAFT_784465 [Galerina marginata CBS 339.88]|uniref:Uncharacterized protein n=1 Tax=Galerina marginata (strain CBS 339.88) TaxID=685588 RepID=A0A067SLY0_GALM3|nr:hypothetical protein GALMADRAFT_784465 [Galerina marginata CBS 339.88]